MKPLFDKACYTSIMPECIALWGTGICKLNLFVQMGFTLYVE
jgi:hypothetical protein